MSSTKVRLKILIHVKKNKVLFAEAGKEFVDFLFNLLSLPVGTVINLLSNNNGMVGCIGNLYTSVENLGENYIQPNQNKDFLLKPTTPVSFSQVPLILSGYESVTRNLYTCPYNHRHVADDPRTQCPNCRALLNWQLSYITPSSTTNATGQASGGDQGGGFVKGLVTYMVTDDLVVEPMSTISSITLMNKISSKEPGSLEERIVEIGMPEGLKLLHASLQSKTVLTNVFLGNEKA